MVVWALPAYQSRASAQLKRWVALGEMGPGAPGFARGHPIADTGPDVHRDPCHPSFHAVEGAMTKPDEVGRRYVDAAITWRRFAWP